MINTVHTHHMDAILMGITIMNNSTHIYRCPIIGNHDNNLHYTHTHVIQMPIEENHDND